jgi:hypothetical protein
MATALGVFASEPESLPAKHVKPMSVVTLNTLPLLQNYYDKYNLPIAYRQTFTGELLAPSSNVRFLPNRNVRW